MQGDINVNAEAQRVLAAGNDRWAQLGLTRGTGLAEVKRRYKRLCALHPDKNLGNALAAEAFAIVSAAYAELSALLAPAGAPAAVAGPLHATQPEAQQQSNRWQAFTGWRQGKQQQTAPQQAPPPAAQHPHPSSSPQENCTPETDCGGFGQQQHQRQAFAAGTCGGWQVSKWGKHAGSALFRAQPVAAVPPAACHASGLDGSTHQRQQQGPPSSKRHSSRRASLSSSSLSIDSGSNGSDSEEAAFAANSRPTGACVQPAAFYGSSSQPRSPAGDAGVPASRATQPPAASLYGLFSGRRSSGGQTGGWLGSQQPLAAAGQPKWPFQQKQPHPEQEQPAQQQQQQQQQQRDHLAWVQQQHEQRPRLPLWRQAAAQPSPPLVSLQQGQAQQLDSPSCQHTSPAESQQGSQPGLAAFKSRAGQAGNRWDNNRSKLELLKRPAAFALPAADRVGSSQPANAQEHVQLQTKQGKASGQAKRQLCVLSSSSDEGSSSDGEGESNSDEGSASEPEPDPALSARDQLMRAVLHQQAAERQAAQAESAAIARAGRDKALQKYRKRRRKSSASRRGISSGKIGGKSSAKGSGSAAGSGGGKQQTQLKLVLVRVPAA